MSAQHLPRIVRIEQAACFRGNFRNLLPAARAGKRNTRRFACKDHALAARSAPTLPVRRHLGNLARSRSTFCTRCVCLCLEQAEETAGIGWGIVVTR